MEKIKNCNWYSDKIIYRCDEKLFYYPDDLMKYTEKVRIAYNKLSNCHVMYAVQSEYMIRMSPVDKLIEENKKKMNEGSYVSNDKLLGEKRKSISRNKLNNQVQQRITNIIETPENDKSLKNKSSNDSSRLTRSRSKLSPCEISMEDKGSNEKYCKEPSDNEVDLKNDLVDVTFSDITVNKVKNDIVKGVISIKECMEYSNDKKISMPESVILKSDSLNNSSNLFIDSSQSLSSKDEESNHTNVSSSIVNVVQCPNKETDEEIQVSSNNSNSSETTSELSELEKFTNKTFPPLRLVTPKLLVKSPAFLKLPENKLSRIIIDEDGNCQNKLPLSHNSPTDSGSVNSTESSENQLSVALKPTDKIEIDESINKSLNKESILAEQSNHKLELDRNAIRKKNLFMSALGLVDVHKVAKTIKKDSNDGMTKKNLTIQKMPPHKTSEELLDRGLKRSSSEKLRRSFLLEYSNEKDEKHSAVPILIPELASGSSFHPGRTCMLKCSYCHGKFGLYDTPCHIAQIKNSEKQIACLENVTHLIGPDSCLCDACFRAIEKRSWKRSIQQSGCIIFNCIRKSTNILKPQVLEKLRKIDKNTDVVLRDWQYKSEPMPICCLHYEKIITMLQCQLCGNRATLKFDLIRDEHNKFQKILEDDEIPFKLDENLLICKPCRVYLIWRTTNDTGTKDRPDFIVHRNTVVRRICLHNNYMFPSYLSADKSTLDKSKPKEVETCASGIVSSFPATINSNVSINSEQINTPRLSTSHISSLTKNKRRIGQIKNQVAYVDEETFELFNKLRKPHNSSKVLVNHLLTIEKARKDGHLVLADEEDEEDEEDEKKEIQKINRDENEKSYDCHTTSVPSDIVSPTKNNYGKHKIDNYFLDDFHVLKKPSTTELIGNINAIKDYEIGKDAKYFQAPSNKNNKHLCENKLRKQVEFVTDTNCALKKCATVSISPKIIDVLSNTSSSNLLKSSKIEIVSDQRSLNKTVPFTSNVRVSFVKPNISDQVSGGQKLIRFVNPKGSTTGKMHSTITNGTFFGK